MSDMYDGADPPVDSNGEKVKLYDWEDHKTHRQLIFDDAKNSLVKQFPKEYNGKRLELTDVEYEDPENYNIATQKKMLHNDGFAGRRLRGTMTLYDSNTGEQLDSKKVTLMKMPYLTNRGTFIKDGNEWGTISQTRLLPGAYARRQNNGDLEMQFNVRPGTGGAFRVNMNPESAQYKISVGGSELHLYSLMKDLGVEDDDLRARWGDDVFKANAENYDSRVLDKAYNKLVPEWDRGKNPDRSKQDKVQLIKDALNRAQMASKVAKRTLPTMFDSEKRASWRMAGDAMDKVASMTTDDLEDVAEFVNAVLGANINLDCPKKELVAQIQAAIADNEKDSNPGVAAVKKRRAARAMEMINSRMNMA